MIVVFIVLCHCLESSASLLKVSSQFIVVSIFQLQIIVSVFIVLRHCLEIIAGPVAIYASRYAENNKKAFFMIGSYDGWLPILGVMLYAFMKNVQF